MFSVEAAFEDVHDFHGIRAKLRFQIGHLARLRTDEQPREVVSRSGLLDGLSGLDDVAVGHNARDGRGVTDLRAN